MLSTEYSFLIRVLRLEAQEKDTIPWPTDVEKQNWACPTCYYPPK